MHSYATDNRHRTKAYLFVAAISAVVSSTLSAAFGMVSKRYDLNLPPAIAATVVSLGSFGVVYEIFNRYLWRIGWIRKLLGISVPDLNGLWAAITYPNYRREIGEPPHLEEIRIEQTWSAIQFKMRTWEKSAIDTPWYECSLLSLAKSVTAGIEDISAAGADIVVVVSVEGMAKTQAPDFRASQKWTYDDTRGRADGRYFTNRVFSSERKQLGVQSVEVCKREGSQGPMICRRLNRNCASKDIDEMFDAFKAQNAENAASTHDSKAVPAKAQLTFGIIVDMTNEIINRHQK